MRGDSFHVCLFLLFLLGLLALQHCSAIEPNNKDRYYRPNADVMGCLIEPFHKKYPDVTFEYAVIDYSEQPMVYDYNFTTDKFKVENTGVEYGNQSGCRYFINEVEQCAKLLIVVPGEPREKYALYLGWDLRKHFDTDNYICLTDGKVGECSNFKFTIYLFPDKPSEGDKCFYVKWFFIVGLKTEKTSTTTEAPQTTTEAPQTTTTSEASTTESSDAPSSSPSSSSRPPTTRASTPAPTPSTRAFTPFKETRYEVSKKSKKRWQSPLMSLDFTLSRRPRKDEGGKYAESRATSTAPSAWFQFNREDVKARQYTYAEIANHYVYHNYKKHFTRRKKKSVQFPDKYQTMVYAVSPAHPTRFAIRQLACNTKGATSFEDLRTVDGKEYSFIEYFCDS